GARRGGRRRRAAAASDAAPGRGAPPPPARRLDRPDRGRVEREQRDGPQSHPPPAAGARRPHAARGGRRDQVTETRRSFCPKRLLVGALTLVVVGAAANLLGWGIPAWVSPLWDTITGISAEYVVAGVGLLTVQTTAVALGWCSILRFAYPGRGRAREVISCYGASFTLNG